MRSCNARLYINRLLSFVKTLSFLPGAMLDFPYSLSGDEDLCRPKPFTVAPSSCFSPFKAYPSCAFMSCAIQTTSGTCSQAYKGALQNAHMETIMSASGNASTCIKQQTCQPLGGHSIWAAAPPLPITADSSPSQLPIIMLLAPVDSDSLFRSAAVVSIHIKAAAAPPHIAHLHACMGKSWIAPVHTSNIFCS